MSEYGWYGLFTRLRHEKRIVSLLRERGFESFTPVIRVSREYSNYRHALIEVPVFPQYVFVFLDLTDRVAEFRMLDQPGVLGFIKKSGMPMLFSTEQVETLRLSCEHYTVAPRANLGFGELATIIRGPLAGRTGFLSPQLNQETHIIFNIDGTDRAIAVAVDPQDIHRQST